MVVTQNVRLEVGKPFFEDTVTRARESPGEVVMLVRRPGNRVLLSTKSFYPEGVYRLPSGKMHGGETPEEAFRREVTEETGFWVEGAPLCRIRCAFTHEGDSVTFTSHVFITEETSDDPRPQDPDEDITGFEEVDTECLCLIADRLKRLPDDWRDWGRWRAVPHECICRLMSEGSPDT